MNADNDNGSGPVALTGHRYGGSLEAIAEGLMALLVALVAVGAFVHEWHPAPGAQASLSERAVATRHPIF